MDRVIIKPAIPEPPVASPLVTTISFRHPGYESPHDILFRLPRLDHGQRPTDSHDPPSHPDRPTHDGEPSSGPAPRPNTGDGLGAGVHHRTALVACQIVADNAFDGYLATDREGLNEVTTPPDGILTEDTYWFIASRGDGSTGDGNIQTDSHHVYPITPRFEDWVFPHARFAALGWSKAPRNTTHITPEPPNSNSTTATPLGPPPLPPTSSRRRCIISNTSYALHKCHIIPSAQTQWFTTNGMVNYGRGHKLVDDEGNIVHMQHNLHSVWDDNIFALVPKADNTWTVHILATPSYPILEFADAWHNVSLREGALDGRSEAYLFAKFAQAVFMLLKPFVAYSGVDRYVARLQARAGEVRHGYEVKKEWLSSSSLSSMYSGGGSRSASASGSRKRSRSQASVDLEDEDGDGDWYELNVRPGRSWVSDSDDDSEQSEEEEFTRGRSRKRRRRERSAHTVDTIPSLTDTSIDLEEAEPGSKDTSFVLAPSDLPEDHEKRCLDQQGCEKDWVQART